MSTTSFSETVQLASGEGAIIESTGRITFRLLNGTVEIAGRSLPGNDTCSFRCARSGIHFYTLEGGTVQVTSTVATFHICRFSTPVVSLGPMIRDFVSLSGNRAPRMNAGTSFMSPPTGCISNPGSRILILGTRCAGKTLAARTFVNFLFRDAITQRRGSSSIDNVTLICGDPSNTLSDTNLGPGCISSIRVTRPGISLHAPFLENPHVTFFKAASSVVAASSSNGGGETSSTTMEDSAQSLHLLSQALESSRVVLGSSASLTVVDAPQAPSSSSSTGGSEQAITENFYSNLIEIVDPSLILFVGGISPSAAQQQTYNYNRSQHQQQQQSSASLVPEAAVVKNLVDTMNINHNQDASSGGMIHFVPVESFVSSSSSIVSNQQGNKKSVVTPSSLISTSNTAGADLVADRVEQYFCGSAEFPLKCAKLVVPLNKIFFITVSKSGSNMLTPQRVDVAKFYRQLAGRVCGVSLAAVEAETPYANIAGLVLIDSVDVAENEVVLYAPAGGSGAEETCLVRPYLLVGDSKLTYLNHANRGMDSVDANSI